MTYSDKLKHPKWQKKRLKILERDNWKCKYCDDGENQLQIHHLKYTVKEPHDEPDENLITVCENCHQVLEILKKETSFGYLLKLQKGRDMSVAFLSDGLFFIENTPFKSILFISAKAASDIQKNYKIILEKLGL